MGAIGTVLAQIGLAAVGRLVDQLAALLGAYLAAGVAAKVKRFQEANPHLPNAVAALDGLQRFTNETAEILDAYEWGSFFTKDEVNKMKFKALRNRLLEKASSDGLQLADNTINGMINDAVEMLRSRLAESAEAASSN